MTKEKATEVGGSSPRYRMVCVSQKGAPEALGAEFVVGPLDPPLTLEELNVAAVDPGFGAVPPEKLQVSANTGEDGYTVLSLVPALEARDPRGPITPAIRKRTARAASDWEGT